MPDDTTQVMIGPDGQEFHFPVGTTLQTMQAAVRKHGQQGADTAIANATAEASPLHRMAEWGTKFLHGATGQEPDPLEAAPITAGQAVAHPGDALSRFLAPQHLGAATRDVAAMVLPGKAINAVTNPGPVAAMAGRGLSAVAPHLPEVLGTNLSPMLKGLGDAMQTDSRVLPAAADLGEHMPTVADRIPGRTGSMSGTPTITPEMHQAQMEDYYGKGQVPDRYAASPTLIKGQPLEGHLNDALQGLRSESGMDPDTTFVNRYGNTTRTGDTTQGMSDADFQRQLAEPSPFGEGSGADTPFDVKAALGERDAPFQQGIPTDQLSPLQGLKAAAEDTPESATPLPESWQPFAVSEEDTPGWVADRTAEEQARTADNARRQLQRTGGS